ncbi:MAG: hypothetical protein MUP63_00800 [Candidatus Nanohaloarchaeota archaeon QJJ-7]|nr:hypothetical protein [Candidatus Nanohaloarchaeota archaeon QJJ-7]
MKCDKCGREVGSREEEIEHILDQHEDKISSHERDEMKRELNDIDGSGGMSLPVRKLGVGVVLLSLLVLGYGLASTGIISFSTGGDSGPVEVSLGPPGSAHEHAQLSVTVNGDPIEFSKPKYQHSQTQNPRIHFEGGDGSTLHKHATGVTIGYALEQHGISVNETCMTVEDDTYCEDDATTLSLTVNGEEIEDPLSHVLRDNDVIEIVYGESV